MAAPSTTIAFEWAGLQFEWDATKDDANIVKHGFGFENAARAFAGPMLRRRDDRRDYGEQRWIALGAIDGRITVVVVYTLRPRGVRIISARKANRHEKKIYDQAVAQRQARQRREG